MDWWNIKAEHTSYEWAAQIAIYQTAPYGERRADLRGAYHTAHIMMANRTQQTSQDDFREMLNGLTSYLQCDQQDPTEETPDAAALALIAGGI